MATSPRLRLGGIALIAALAVAILLLLSGHGDRAAGDTAAADPSMLTLRLHDLPVGFEVGDDSGCGPLGVEGAAADVAEWVIANRPTGCGFQYRRAFAVPGPRVVPPLVESTATVVGDEAGAAAGLAIAPSLARAETGRRTAPEEAPAPAIGQQARLFHSGDVGVSGRSRGKATFLYWRQGDVLASLLVAGGSEWVNDRVVARLARAQQRHVETPTPYTEAERDDTEVQLDNPRLRFRVHWLGHRFAPGRGLPATTLGEAFASNGDVGPPGDKARLEYDRLSLDIFTGKSWRLYRRSPLWGLVASWHCTRRTPVRLRGGHAVVFAGYATDYARCPERRPEVWFARAFLGATVVVVDMPICGACIRPPYEAGPYGSASGMTAIVRGLRLRPRPRY